MHRIFCLLKASLLSLVCLSVCATSVAASELIGSLEKKLQTTEGLERLDILLSLSEITLNESPERSAQYATQAVTLSGKAASRPQDAHAYLALGRAQHALSDYIAAQESHQKALTIGKLVGAQNIIAEALVNISMAWWRLGNYDKALAFTLEALAIYDALNLPKGKADALHNTGIVYDLIGQPDTALEYHERALVIRQELDDDEGIGSTFKSIGNVYLFQGDYHNAREYYLKSLAIYQKLNDKNGMAGTLNNIGYASQHLDDPKGALQYYQQALNLNQSIGNQYEIANVYHNIGQSQTILKQFQAAQQALSNAFKVAESIGAKELLRENYALSSALYVAQDDYKNALATYQKSIEVKEALFNEEQAKQIASMQTRYESEKQQRELALLKKNTELQELALASEEAIRWALMAGLVFLFFAVFMIYNRYRTQKQAHTLVSQEKEKSDELLLNILPVRVANDLKEKNQTEPESFENVTVYFSDIVGFTTLSTELEPKLLIDELNNIFTAFDNIFEKNNCERIKTIGDAYLSVCGMPEENINHAENIIRSALQIVTYLEERNRRSQMQWELRIGIHTGRVVGGVVGIKKYIYDVFGDTINTASRMESNSEPMKINISESTYQLAKNLFDVSPRGSMSVKGKGEMNMYFVDRIKPSIKQS